MQQLVRPVLPAALERLRRLELQVGRLRQSLAPRLRGNRHMRGRGMGRGGGQREPDALVRAEDGIRVPLLRADLLRLKQCHAGERLADLARLGERLPDHLIALASVRLVLTVKEDAVRPELLDGPQHLLPCLPAPHDQPPAALLQDWRPGHAGRQSGTPPEPPRCPRAPRWRHQTRTAERPASPAGTPHAEPRCLAHASRVGTRRSAVLNFFSAIHPRFPCLLYQTHCLV